ncbi:hypothetical protein PR048_024897 [Dryococelus australis]|uniref:Uncharacterized protein n=1 Tax=Dryococelus australis TaxID=614101 RepID=A0ABQ9GPX7_9NEOP|nr:hypothetical protein PR048_024897 [Dryococelus australis]
MSKQELGVKFAVIDIVNNNKSSTSKQQDIKLKVNNTLLQYESENAEAFRSYFTNIAIEIASRIHKQPEKTATVNKHQYFYSYQYGFLKRKKNTKNAAIDITIKLQSAIDNNNQCAGLFLDLKKDVRHSRS